MDSINNLSPIPGVNVSGSGNYAPTANPYFTVANQFTPRNLHDVIKWSRYITLQSPVTTEVIRKLSTYPITDFVVESSSEKTRDKYKEVFKSFRLKPLLYDVGFEYYTVGNVFVSIYFPIHRSLKCPKCSTEYNSKKAEFTTFKKFSFHGVCPSCNYNGNFEMKDSKSYSIEDMNLIKWDPLNISVNNNPITGESEFYYKIPNDIKKRVQLGDKLFVNSVPWGFIEAIKNNQDFKFDKSNIFHLKNISAGQSISGVAIPPLVSLFSLVYYQATLRKANESISTDFMNPLRVIYPTPQTTNSDPVVSISMRNFVSNMSEAFIKHKKDKSHVVIAPVPIGYQAISGEGKNLLVSQEIQQAEESILLSLGVSKELLSGVTNWSSSTVGLRLLQNTMNSYITQINELINWVMTKVASYLKVEVCEVNLVPFKLTDDDALRQMLVQMHSAGEGSPSTMYEAFGMDYTEELKSQQRDAIAKAVHEVEMKFSVEQAVFAASKQVVDKFDKNSDYRTALAKAQGLAQQLTQVDENTQMQVLGELRVTDYPMYLLTSTLISEIKEQASAAVQQINGLDPNSQDPSGEGQSQGPSNENQTDPGAGSHQPQPQPQQGTK